VLRKLLIGLLVLLAVAAVVGLTMPTTWRVERTAVIAAPAAVVFPLIDDLERWPEWTSWNTSADPSMTRTFKGGKTAGAGAEMAWDGDEVGEGSLTIAESVPGRRVRYELELEQDGFVSHGQIALEPARDGVIVTWSTEGELGLNPLVRLMGPWIERAVGTDFEVGLTGLKRAAEGKRI
jgi:uncharacterized protein YndB with AHSA1/START domain